MGKFSLQNKKILDELLLSNPLIRSGKMFGYPAYYVGKKLSICLIEDGVGVKIPQKSVEILLANDKKITPFQPMGKLKMKEWIQINVESPQDLLKYGSLFEESIQYILSLNQS